MTEEHAASRTARRVGATGNEGLGTARQAQGPQSRDRMADAARRRGQRSDTVLLASRVAELEEVAILAQ